MGKQVTVAEVWTIPLPNSGLYTLDNTVVLSDAQFASLPAKYVDEALTDISDTMDPVDPVVGGPADAADVSFDDSDDSTISGNTVQAALDSVDAILTPINEALDAFEWSALTLINGWAAADDTVPSLAIDFINQTVYMQGHLLPGEAVTSTVFAEIPAEAQPNAEYDLIMTGFSAEYSSVINYVMAIGPTSLAVKAFPLPSTTPPDGASLPIDCHYPLIVETSG